MQNSRVLYLEGRPKAHILHRRLAQSLGVDVEFIDPIARWQDKQGSFLHNIRCWFKNARYLNKTYPDHNIFLVDNLHFTPVIMNLFFSRGKRKLIVHLGSHTLYFMQANIFSTINNWIHKQCLRRYDVLLCEGEMAKEFASKLLGKKTPPSYVTFLGPPAERYSVLSGIAPSLTSHTIIIIANGPTAFRKFYKGLDVMLKAFASARKKLPMLTLQILGSWNDQIIKELRSSMDPDTRAAVSFLGEVSAIEDYLVTSGLCLHCTRGDAFPTSTLEAMAAGIPTIVSEWTGTKEVIEKVDKRLVVALDVSEIAARIEWYYSLDISERDRLSLSSKTVVKSYTEELAIKHYQTTFAQVREAIAN